MKFRTGYVSSGGGRAPYQAAPAAASVNSYLHHCGVISHPKRENRTLKPNLCRAGGLLAFMLLATAWATASAEGSNVYVLTSTNNPTGNNVVVFELNTGDTPSLSLVNMLPTGGNGGASGNGGILQFGEGLGAVANYGSNTVTQLVRQDDLIRIGPTIKLSPGCANPDSVALTANQLFVVGTNCVESHAWPSGSVDGTVVSLTDPSAGQIAAGTTWAAVTLKSGYVVQLPLTAQGALNGTSSTITLPAGANNTPLGATFWGNILGFNPAHSPYSFALVDENQNVTPILGPAPAYPTNAPCWVAKGPGSLWYTGNSPGTAITEFFSDGQNGLLYKSISLPGSPSDITVSRDGQWLAVIYAAGPSAYVAVYSIDAYGDLTYVATSSAIEGVAGFSGVAFSE